MTELVARAIDFAGSGDSAAAMVAISAPTIEKITTTMAEKIAAPPRGNQPPCAVRLLKSSPLSGQAPMTKRVPRTRKRMIAAHLMPENPNSNSPTDQTENRLVNVISVIRISDINHNGTSIQYWITLAPATASNPMTMTQKYQ